MLGNNEDDTDKLLRKLEKRINGYFGSRYKIEDFDLTGMILTTDIDVRDQKNVSAYLKVLQRIGKVKGFSPSSYECFDDNISFCLDGNSNGIEFIIYDLAGLFRKKLDEAEHGRKQLKSIIETSKGILRAEVHITGSKAIGACTEKTSTSKQIADLSEKCEKIFLDTFMRIIPFGNFHKKDKAVEIIRKEVTDQRLKRRMLRLLELVPEKKSLLLAQKTLNYRRIDAVMEAFAELHLSPVTISKRHDVKNLQNLYVFL